MNSKNKFLYLLYVNRNKARFDLHYIKAHREIKPLMVSGVPEESLVIEIPGNIGSRNLSIGKYWKGNRVDWSLNISDKMFMIWENQIICNPVIRKKFVSHFCLIFDKYLKSRFVDIKYEIIAKLYEKFCYLLTKRYDYKYNIQRDLFIFISEKTKLGNDGLFFFRYYSTSKLNRCQI